MEAEREFSKLKLILTDLRNALHEVSISSLMKTTHWLSNQGKTASTVDFPSKLVQTCLTVQASAPIIER